MRVLIVDDSPALRARVVALVREGGRDAVVDQARNVAEALALVQSATPDLVFLDLQLPGPSGLELLVQLKRMRPTPGIVVLTNHATEQYRRECLRQGADDFLDKSRQFDRVAEHVRRRTAR